MEFLQREELPMATLPTERPVTPLRQRMLDDMAMRSMRSRTQHDYVRHVRAFAAFLKRSPDTATAEDVRRFQMHQREHGAGESVISATVSALRFLFSVTLDRPDLSRKLVLAPRPRRRRRASGTGRRWAARTVPGCGCRKLLTSGPTISTANAC